MKYSNLTIEQLLALLPECIESTKGGTYRKALIETDEGWCATFMRMNRKNTPEYYNSSHSPSPNEALAKLVRWFDTQ